jgi:uncharacterized protein with PQ loop repeat
MELLLASIIMNLIIIPLVISGIKTENERKLNPPFFGYKIDYDVEIILGTIGTVSLVGGILLAIFN